MIFCFCVCSFITPAPSYLHIPLTLVSSALLFGSQVCPHLASVLHIVIFHFMLLCSYPLSFCYQPVLQSCIYRAALLRYVPSKKQLVRTVCCLNAARISEREANINHKPSSICLASRYKKNQKSPSMNRDTLAEAVYLASQILYKILKKSRIFHTVFSF